MPSRLRKRKQRSSHEELISLYCWQGSVGHLCCLNPRWGWCRVFYSASCPCRQSSVRSIGHLFTDSKASPFGKAGKTPPVAGRVPSLREPAQKSFQSFPIGALGKKHSISPSRARAVPFFGAAQFR